MRDKVTHILFLTRTPTPPHPSSSVQRSRPGQEHVEQKQACSAPSSCRCDRPEWSTKPLWALMTSGEYRRFNHDQVRSAEGALPAEALPRLNTSGPEAAAGLAQEAQKQLTHINTPSNSWQNLTKEQKTRQGQTQKGSKIDFISVLSAGDTYHSTGIAYTILNKLYYQ